MPIGMEITNSAGTIQVNQDFKIMQMVEKVASSTVTPTTSGTGIYQGRTHAFTFNYTDAVYAVSQSGGSTTPLSIVTSLPSGGTTAVSVISRGIHTAPTFDVFAFRAAGAGTSVSGAGFELYNADGSLGFSSLQKCLRVLSQFDWRLDQSGDPGVFFSADDYAETWSGRRVACIMSRHARALDGEGSLITMTVPVYSAYFTNTPSTGDSRLSWQVVNNAGKDLPYWERKGRFMFVDVSNY